MKRFKSVLLLGILAISLFASTCLVSATSAKRQAKGKWLHWNVYLFFPMGIPGPSVPYAMDSNLEWVDYIMPGAPPLVEEKVWGKMFFFFASVRDAVDSPCAGEYTIDMVIVWRLEEGEPPLVFYPGRTSVVGKLKLQNGTGYFEGMKAHGYVEVEVTTHTDSDIPPPPDWYEGPILIQRQVVILQCINPSK